MPYDNERWEEDGGAAPRDVIVETVANETELLAKLDELREREVSSGKLRESMGDKMALAMGLLVSDPVPRPVSIPSYDPNSESEDMGAPVTLAEKELQKVATSLRETDELLSVYTDLVLWMDTGLNLVQSIRKMGGDKEKTIGRILTMVKAREPSFTKERRKRYF